MSSNKAILKVTIRSCLFEFLAPDETAFVTATEATLRSDPCSHKNDANRTTFMSPSTTAFLPAANSTTLSSAKFVDNDETFKDDEEIDVTISNATLLVSS